MSRTAESYRIANFFDWSGGIQDRRKNPLAFPPNALMAGENVELVDGGLKTRGGVSVTSADSLPAGEVMAMSQVRFPSNEVSYLVAQVKDVGVPFSAADQDTSPPARIEHYACYDSYRGRVWVFGGTSLDTGDELNDLWYYDCDTGTWTEITDATGAPTWTASHNDMVYDPVEDRLIVYVGYGHTAEGLEIGADGWMSYDIDTNTWTELKAEEDPSFVTGTGDYRRQNGRMILRDRMAIVYGGWDGETTVGFMYYDVDTPAALPPDTLEWTVTGGGSGLAATGFATMAYDSVNDVAMITGSPAGNSAWLCDFNTMTQTQIDDIPLADGLFFSGGTLCYCSGKWFFFGSADSEPGVVTLLSQLSWVYSDGAWTSCAFVPDPSARYGSKAFVVGTDILLCLGQHSDTDPDTGNPIPVNGMEVLTGMCTWTPADTLGSRLYACSDHLPTTTATFTDIFNLLEADRVSFAVLNDRVVITEGKAQPPLVWGGAMTDDGSDWMYPKAVLVSQDGENFYDVSAQVLDKDTDNAANVGLIRAAGFLAVCTDMPKVEGFYFEMETPNGVATDTPGNQQIALMTPATADDVAWQDLKGLVANWVQDSGATGHFTDSSNNAVTLGTGNQCPDVETGLHVWFAASDTSIVAITGDGSGSGAVTLSAATTSQAVTQITGFTVGVHGLSVNEEYSPVITAWSKTPGTDQFPASGYSIRQVIPGSEITHDGDRFQFTIRVGYTVPYPGSPVTLRGTHHPLAYTLTNAPYMISRISIVERDGETANGVTTPTPITFPMRPSLRSETGEYTFKAYPSYTITDSNGTLYLTIATYSLLNDPTTMVSDQIEYAIDETKDYLLIMDVMDAWQNHNSSRAGYLHRTTGAGYYYLSDDYNAPETWNVQDVSEMGFSFQEGYVIGAVELQVQDRFPLATQLLVAHTTDDMHFDMSVIEDFQGVTANQTAAGSSHVYHAVSLDDRATFQVFLNSAWRTIVREESGAWQYIDGSDAWQNASVDTLLQALRQAFAITENQMSAAELADITSAQWKDTGGIIVHITPHMDFAVGMVADSTHAPFVESYALTYNDTGATAIQGWSGDRWTAGTGWTDNTRLNEIPFGQSGTITYDGSTPFDAQYHVLNEVPGYWFRFQSNGTSANTSITRILYKAPCQPLANIGDGQPDTPLAFIYYDVSKDSKKDLTIEVSGARGSFTTDVDGKVVYSATDAVIPVGTDDYLYLGYLLQFDQVEITPYDNANAEASVLSAEYWNGEAWTAIEITDETVDTATSTKTLFTKGKVSWLLPADWKMHIPLDADFPRGYYIRFKVSVALTATTSIDEVRVYAIPKELAKHKFAVAFRDRIALVSRPDAPDQVDISRALEEYGFIGADSGSYRVGGMDSLQCAVPAWNGLFLGKTETWHQLLGQNPETFTCEGVEAARHIPLSSRVIVKAPMAGIDAGTRYGLFYINRFGAFVSTGLQTDTAWNTGRGALLSDSVNWWDGRAVPRLALDSLHQACGEYWPVKNWIIWSVPMITAAGQSSQATNNRLIIFDMALRTWLPPFTINVACLTAAYHCNTNAPGRLGEMGLYAGDYQGRIIRLFGPADTTDFGEPIGAWIETGWLHLGSPDWIKLIRHFQIYGHTATGKDITVKIWADGNTDPDSPNYTILLSDLDELGGRFFSREEASLNTQGRFFKLRIELQDVAHIFGIQIGASLIREWGAH